MSDSVNITSRSGRQLHRHGMPWILGPVIVAFMAGGGAIASDNWWLFWLSVGVILVSAPANWVIRVVEENPYAQVEQAGSGGGKRAA
jgi:hypothetical protein